MLPLLLLIVDAGSPYEIVRCPVAGVVFARYLAIAEVHCAKRYFKRLSVGLHPLNSPDDNSTVCVAGPKANPCGTPWLLAPGFASAVRSLHFLLWVSIHVRPVRFPNIVQLRGEYGIKVGELQEKV